MKCSVALCQRLAAVHGRCHMHEGQISRYGALLRKRRYFDRAKAAELRAQGLSYAAVGEALGGYTKQAVAHQLNHAPRRDPRPFETAGAYEKRARAQAGPAPIDRSDPAERHRRWYLNNLGRKPS